MRNWIDKKSPTFLGGEFSFGLTEKGVILFSFLAFNNPFTPSY